jgi:hypothetical protein
VNRYRKLVAHFNSRQVHQGRIEDDALGITNLGNGLGHGVILCFTVPGATDSECETDVAQLRASLIPLVLRAKLPATRRDIDATALSYGARKTSLS